MVKKAILISAVAVLLLTLSAGAQNNPPVVEPLSNTTIAEGEIISWTITATDADPDDTIWLSIVPPADDPVYKGYVVFADNGGGDGQFQFTPGYDLVPDDQQTIFPVNFLATDGIDTGTALATITVIDFNPPPELDSIGNHRIAEGVEFNLPVSATDPDGAIPVLTAAPLPANANFVDSGNGNGLFTFTPDETQYGDSAQDYSITFTASDGENTDAEIVRITVVGPNIPPILNSIGSRSMTEGDTLSVTVSASDPNETAFLIYTSERPENAFFTPAGDGTALFEFFPDFLQAGDYTITFYADDGEYIDSEVVDITVTEAGNQTPIFEPIADIRMNEGDSLSLPIIARDPEEKQVTITMLDTIPNSSFTQVASGVGTFTYTPDLTDGGTYEVGFNAADDSTSADITVLIEVTEVDFPPEMTIDPAGSQTMYEGRVLHLDLSASDVEQGALNFGIFPPADSAVFKGNAVFVSRGNSTGYFEFKPDYNQVRQFNDTTYVITFMTWDSVETVSKEVSLTVYNVRPDAKDPGVADTLTLGNGVWDELLGTVALTARIWNDSIITAALTGFRWQEPWLRCDSVRLGARLDSADFKYGFINNDSLVFLVGFYYYLPRVLPPGEGEYFTAYFSYDTASVSIDSVPSVRLDTAKVGSSGDFFFDREPRYPPTKESPEEILELLRSSPLTYKPLVKLGEIRSASDSVTMRIFDIDAATILGKGSFLYMYNAEDTPVQYEIRLGLENRNRLGGISLGFRLFSDDGASWSFGDSLFTFAPVSRMNPDTAVWRGSGGLQATLASLDGVLADSILFNGSAGGDPDAGLAIGLAEHMIVIPFTVGGVSGSEVKTICFDTATIGASGVWEYTDMLGNPVTPKFSGGICFPVAASMISTGAEGPTAAVPGTYSLSQNYPNPFNPSTTIRFRLPRSEKVTITVYNILGQVVAILADRYFTAGEHSVIWDGRDNEGHSAATGIYLYHFVSEGMIATRKMILLK